MYIPSSIYVYTKSPFITLAKRYNHTMAATHISTIILLLLFTTTSSSNSDSYHDHQPIKGVYYPSWVRDTLSPSSIKTSLFTHIYYAFLTPNADTFEFANNIGNAESLFLLNFTSTLHAKTPPVQTLFSVGGAAEGHALFSRMASAPWSRAAFVNSSIRVARRLGFDGIDLDWEFPQNRTDMENLASLLEEWRVAVREEAAAAGRPPLLLTAAVYYSADGFLSGAARAYPAGSITRNLDWVNVMNYDYRGGWDPSATGAHAALFDPRSNVSTSYGLGSWIRVGVPRSKLIMGLPLYARTWELRDPGSHGIGAPAVAVGPGGGVLTYAEVVRFNRERRAKVVYDSRTVSVYSVAGTSWIGYDDERSVAVKIRYARALGLRGYFFWAIHGDYEWSISGRASQVWFH